MYLPGLHSLFETDCILPMESVSLSIDQLSLYYGLLLNFFLLQAKDLSLGGSSQELAQDLEHQHLLYGCENCTLKKVECWRIDAFELWCWRRLLRIPWTARRSNQSVLKKISPEYSLEGLILKLKLQYFGHLIELTHWKRPWCWKGLGAGGEWDDRGWDGWMASPTQWTWVWAISWSWWWTGKLGILQSIGLQRVGHDWETELTDFFATSLRRIVINLLLTYQKMGRNFPNGSVAKTLSSQCKGSWFNPRSEN